jgi:hypothetical protein
MQEDHILRDKNLIQDSKESRGRQMLKENNIIFTLEG